MPYELTDDWSSREINHGYAIFDGEYPTEYGYIDGLHIEALDIVGIFVSDEYAAECATKEIGVAIIKDVPLLNKVFIDTPDNREKIIKQIKKENALCQKL